jgi:anti-sigma factor RsiW
MNCAELDILLSDYLDGTLPAEQKPELERHLAGCPACDEIARDAAAARSFMERAAPVEPPPELITRILFETRSDSQRRAEGKKGFRKWFGGLLEPILQPRFAMGMAMTILSFSMLGRFAGMEIRQLTPEDLAPARVWEAVDDRAHRSWARAVKFYESVRVVYEIQTRIGDWFQVERNSGDGSATAETSQPDGSNGSPGVGSDGSAQSQQGSPRESVK